MAKENVKKESSAKKIKRKVWYRIISPKIFGQREVGETYIENPEQAVGRSVMINLKELTGNVKDQSYDVMFKITRADGTQLRTATIGYILSPTYVKRVVRKNSSRLDDVMTIKTRSGQDVVLKSFTVVAHRVQRSVRSALRREIVAFYTEELARSTFDGFIANLVTRKLQSALKKRLSKIYLTKEVSVRVLELKDAPIDGEEPIVDEPVRAPEAVDQQVSADAE
ncbi:hypothetical protein HYV86_04965 [Candidatus Woesearchaeota archaeon]|nr:hypothetical protein [Candidatus Woesearchaeota archaeon]